MSNETTTTTTKHNPFHDPNPCYLGDFVEHINEPSLRGRVVDAHFWCPENKTWLRGQTLLGPNPMQYRKKRWVSILIHDGGSIVVPDSFIRVIDPFPIRNNSLGLYFPLDEWAVQDRPEPTGEPIALSDVTEGQRISTWGFEVYEGGSMAGMGNWWTGTVADFLEINEDWYQVIFDDKTVVRVIAHARTKLA